MNEGQVAQWERFRKLTIHADVVVGQTKLRVADIRDIEKGSLIRLKTGTDDAFTLVTRGKHLATGRIHEFDGNYALKVETTAKGDRVDAEES